MNSILSSNIGMGTVINNKIFGGNAKIALQAASKEVLRLEGMLSKFIYNSEISRINDLSGIRSEEISNETFEVLSRAVEFSECCNGFFDITIGPLITLWASAYDKSKVPDETIIREKVSLVCYKDLFLDNKNKSAYLKNSGQSIDLGGIGKGFAADRLIKVLKEYGIFSAFTNFGGNVATIGVKPDGSPWHVGIRHPRKENSLIGTVSVSNKSVVTSGDYQRNFIDVHGKMYHHILSTNTGYPVESGLISVTIIADSSMNADALSTIFFLAGRNRGIEVLKSYPGTEVIFVDINLMVYVSRGLKDCFQVCKGIGVDILDI